MIAFIDDHRDAYGIEPICRVLPIAPSTYYEHVAHRQDPSRLSARAREDGRICLTNNAAEREQRSVARGRKAWLFVGSDRGGERAAMMYSLIGTARLNGVDPLAWLTDVLVRIADLPQSRLHELLPREWTRLRKTLLVQEAT